MSIPNGYDPNASSGSTDAGTLPMASGGGSFGAFDGSLATNPNTSEGDGPGAHEDSDAGGDVVPCSTCDASTPTGTPTDVGSAEGGAPTGQTLTSDSADAAVPEAQSSAKWLLAEPLFDQSAIANIALQIPTEGLDALNADSATYVAGSIDVTLANGTHLELADVGIRLKGQWGSARTLDEKAAFLLKMNEFVPDQKLLSLNKLALNNMVQDPSMLREQLSYELFRAMGVPAPRTAYARVTLNDELMGLYASVEVVDNASFLDHWFGDDNGNLYEGAYGSDLEYDLIETFDQDRGADVAFADLYELSAALDQMVEPETFVAEVEPWFELDAYAQFAATELFLAHWDGYAATRNNFFLYRAPGAKWSFIPWGTDQTFGDAGYSVFDGNGRLQNLCTASLACRQKLGAAYEQLIELVDELALLSRVDELEELISQAAEEDPRKEADDETLHSTIEELREFLRTRSTSARDQLICTDPSNVDQDEDGASGCGADCNDGDPARYPGATETCNFVDDDCNGQIDELDECESCVEHERSGGGKYALCFGPGSYAEAQADCRDQGGDLASIHGSEQQVEIDALVDEIGLNEWWIGLSDRGDEGQFEWEDGSLVDFENWNQGEPNDAGENEDCTHLTGWGAWNDVDCAVGFAYICQLP